MRDARFYDALRVKRMHGLCGCFDLLKDCYADFSNVVLNQPLAAEVIEEYIDQYRVLVELYRIADKIQRHRIAGLMASAILKKRPISLIDSSLGGATVSRDNEFLAAWHGISICSENVDPDRLEELRRKPQWSNWFGELIFIMTRTNDGEALSAVFGTVSMLYFGDTSGGD